MILSTHGIVGSQITQFVGLLDTYSGSTAAYSLRLLRTDYTGSAIRVRRASDNTEQDIGFVNNELDTASLTSFCSGTNGFVKTWYDQSGNGRDATQSTAANQPQIVSGGSVILENGKPAVQFDGSDDFYTNNLAVSTLTSFAVSRIVSESDFNFIYDTNLHIDNARLRMGLWNNNTYFVDNSGAFSTNATSTIFSNNQQHKWYGLHDTSGTEISIDSESVQTNTNTLFSGTTTDMYIGARNDGIDHYLEGTIQELILYPSDQSSNRTGIETNINAQYQIYWDGSQTSLLDDYSGSAAAYSLRALSSSYTGALIEVRRASDNATQDIYAKYDGTLNVDALESFCSGTNGFVTTWYDQSGNSNDATQATASDQPQIVSSGSVILENGKPAVQFDGSDDYFDLTSNIATNVDYTGFQVLKRNATSTASITMAGISINDSYLSWNFSDNNIYFRGSRGYVQSSLDVTSQSLFTSLNIHTGNMTIYNNGSSVVSSSPTTLSGTSVMNAIGRRGVNYGIGTTQEIIIYNSDQSSNRTGIETNINDFYSIYP